MANPYYAPGEQRPLRVNDLFDAIAIRYDLINDLQSLGLHRWWKRRLVKLSGAKKGLSALDLCCGTGDIAFTLQKAGAQVTGLDFSAQMLRVAAGRLARWRSGQNFSAALVAGHQPGACPADLVRGDAMTLPFGDNQFDIVTVGYGLRNLTDFERGLEEMHRVAKPGGRLLVLDFGKPESPFLRRLYFGYLRWMVPIFGLLFAGNSAAYSYILESLHHYPAQQGVAAKMRQMNCANVKVLDLLGGAMSINYGEKQ